MMMVTERKLAVGLISRASLVSSSNLHRCHSSLATRPTSCYSADAIGCHLGCSAALPCCCSAVLLLLYCCAALPCSPLRNLIASNPTALHHPMKEILPMSKILTESLQRTLTGNLFQIQINIAIRCFCVRPRMNRFPRRNTSSVHVCVCTCVCVCVCVCVWKRGYVGEEVFRFKLRGGAT